MHKMELSKIRNLNCYTSLERKRIAVVCSEWQSADVLRSVGTITPGAVIVKTSSWKEWLGSDRMKRKYRIRVLGKQYSRERIGRLIHEPPEVPLQEEAHEFNRDGDCVILFDRCDFQYISMTTYDNEPWGKLGIVLEALVKDLPDTVVLDDLVPMPGRDPVWCLSYRDIWDKRDKPSLRQDKSAALIVYYGGYGDVMLVMDQIRRFAERRQSEGQTVSVVTPFGKVRELLEHFLPEIALTHAYLPYMLTEAVCMSGRYDECYVIGDRLPRGRYHITELSAQILGVEPYTAPVSLACRPVKKEIKQSLATMRGRYASLIGTQFVSQYRDKSWSAAAIADFVRMCHRAGIGVVRLGSDYDEGEHVLDLSRFSIDELTPVIASLDAVVAIDSVFGHIAGLSGIPSITIWGRDTPGRMKHYDPAVEASYRPLTMNYGVVPMSGEIGDVTPDRVFHALQLILTGCIRLSERFIVMDETHVGRYTDFV